MRLVHNGQVSVAKCTVNGIKVCSYFQMIIYIKDKKIFPHVIALYLLSFYTTFEVDSISARRP